MPDLLKHLSEQSAQTQENLAQNQETDPNEQMIPQQQEQMLGGSPIQSDEDRTRVPRPATKPIHPEPYKMVIIPTIGLAYVRLHGRLV